MALPPFSLLTLSAFPPLIFRVESNAHRYMQVFSDAIGGLLEERVIEPSVDLEGLEDVYDVLVQQREQRIHALELNGTADTDMIVGEGGRVEHGGLMPWVGEG